QATPVSQVPHTPPQESSPHERPSHCLTQPSASPSPPPSFLAPMTPSQAMSRSPVIATERNRLHLSSRLHLSAERWSELRANVAQLLDMNGLAPVWVQP